jgi:hypothetical protein
LTVGGGLLLKKTQVGDGFMIAYLVVSSTAFLINFLLNLREIQHLRGIRELRESRAFEPFNTNELALPATQATFEGLPSITENTTRELQSISKESAH